MEIVWTILSGFSKVFGAVVTFFTTKPGVYVGIVLMGVGTGWYLNHHGYSSGLAEGQRQEADHIAAARFAASEKARADQIALDQGIAAAAENAGFLRGKAEAKTLYITKEVPKYVTVEVDRDFPVPCALYRVVRAAEAGTDPEAVSLPAGLSDGDRCSIAASDIADNAVAVIGRYYEAEAKITGLQGLAKALAAGVTQ